jgi:DNA recombination protein RmuC
VDLDTLVSFAQAHWPYGVTLLAGIAVGFGVCLNISRQRVRAAFESGLTSELEKHGAETQLLRERIEMRGRELSRLEGQVETLNAELVATRDRLEARTGELAQSVAVQAGQQARLEETSRSFAEKEKLFRESSDALKQEFELLANRIFEQQGTRHQEKLSTVLLPFREQIGDFRKRVEEVYHTESKDRASLLSEVKNLQQASERINEETENLTKALKGDVKLQGNWGEIVLERILEASGLRAGHEYFLQETRRSGSGDIKRPDVRIQLPDDKDVVVDAKVSLLAYEQALSAATDEARQQAVEKHLASLRAHVRRLSEQDYDQLRDIRSLDFVLLFVPIESAFTLAMEHEHKLFTDAFDKRIVIVSPTTLMMTLRVIHNVWRFDKQNRNAEEIARKAGALYDKLRGLIEDMETLGRQLETAQKTYQSALGKITSGKGNLVSQVERFRELGAKVKKPLSRKVLKRAEADPETESPDPSPAHDSSATYTRSEADPDSDPQTHKEPLANG